MPTLPDKPAWVGLVWSVPTAMQRLQQRWASLGKRQQHFLSNLMVGIVVALALHGLHHSHTWHPLEHAEDSAVDWMIQVFSGTEARKATIPFVWLDVDEETYRNWGEPLYTPRDKLKQLIQFAAEAKPLTIIVDFELSRAGDRPEQDQALRDYLAGYADRCAEASASGSKPCPPIILMRGFRRGLGETAPVPRPSFLDKAIEGSNKVFWGATLFHLERDGAVRRWRLWETPYPDVVQPSVQLLAYVQLKCSAPEALQPYLAGKLTDQALNECLRHVVASPQPMSASPEQAPSPTRAEDKEEKLAQRILYAIAWRPRMPSGTGTASHATEASLAHDAAPYPAMPRLPLHGRKVDVIQAVPARLVTQGQPADGRALLADRVVVIGASHLDSGDIHRTPLGYMPGALILINSIISLSEYGQLERPALGWMLLCEVVLIVLMSLVFMWFDSIRGMLISGALIILLLLPVSFLLFRYGVWLDFSLPLLAVQAHRLVKKIQELLAG